MGSTREAEISDLKGQTGHPVDTGLCLPDLRPSQRGLMPSREQQQDARGGASSTQAKCGQESQPPARAGKQFASGQPLNAGSKLWNSQAQVCPGLVNRGNFS